LLLTNNNNNNDDDDDAEVEIEIEVEMKVKEEGANNNNNRTDDEEDDEKSETKTSLQQPEKPPPPPPPELTSYRNCYVCKAKYTKLHFFYDTMCLQCGDLNYKKRFQTADLTNHVALITGSRLKIGYHATLLLLRAGAIVIATTRFPADSAIRYSKETDYDVWCTRLHIHGLDLRHTPSVELFCNYIEQTYHRLDILINNAATTVRRPPGFYSHMLHNEYLSFSDHPPSVQRLLTSHYKCLNNLLLPRTRGGDGGEPCIRSSDDNNSYNEDISTIAVTTFADGDVDADADDAAVAAAATAATDISALTLTTTSGADATADATTDASASANNNDFAAVTWDTKGPGIGLRASAQLSQIPYSYDSNGGDGNDSNSNGEGEIQIREEVLFPEGKLDVDLQQVDLRSTNSWRLTLGEISSMELLECMLVNAVAPFVLCNRLTPMMKRCSPNRHGCKHIVNVTAMEGKFYTFHKPSARHPHTNMAKAALNMLTHTSSVELVKYGIYMNAVDTGWVTDEDPVQLATGEKVKVHDFQPPLDIVDGAARICDPFFDGIHRGEHWCGKFLKDYFPIDW